MTICAALTNLRETIVLKTEIFSSLLFCVYQSLRYIANILTSGMPDLYCDGYLIHHTIYSICNTIPLLDFYLCTYSVNPFIWSVGLHTVSCLQFLYLYRNNMFAQFDFVHNLC